MYACVRACVRVRACVFQRVCVQVSKVCVCVCCLCVSMPTIEQDGANHNETFTLKVIRNNPLPNVLGIHA